MKKHLRLGARPSRLAVKQAEEIVRSLPSIGFEIVSISTWGDADKRTPLSRMEESNFFTREIEDALLCGEIDVAVHSAKDLEEDIPEDLTIAAMTGSISPYECLVSRMGQTLDELPAGAIVGTSSVKRREAILKYRSDLVVKDIRGNIDERLGKLDSGDFDAIIVAHAALIRLGLADRASQIIPADIIIPHPLQGRLAIQVRKDRKDLLEIFRGINEN